MLTRSLLATWAAPALLLAFVAVPLAAGAARVVELARGAQITSANARFFESPLPVVLHVVAVALFCIGGAFQFVPTLRRGAWHRRAGRAVLAGGFVASVTGLWMSAAYRPIPHDNDLVFFFRIVFGGLMTIALVASFRAIRRGDVEGHRAWVIRAYAIGLGAATQAVLHAPWLVFAGGLPDDVTRSGLMGGAWLLNLVVGEVIVRRVTSRA